MAEKTATPSNEKYVPPTSAGNTAAAFTPMQAYDAWKKVIEEQISRMSAVYEEFAKLEGKGLQQARNSIDEVSKAMKDSITYANEYSSEWRRLTLDAARRTAELITRRV